MRKVLIIAGGTGGHIFPGLAVAAALQQHNIDVHWLGSKIGLEQQLVSPHYPLLCIAAERVRGRRGLNHLLTPWYLLRATWQAWRIIRQLQPDVVLAMGGFVCAPGGVATKLAGRPLVIHEQNAIAGYTNRVLARIANAVTTAFPQTFAANLHPQTVGNPVRAEIATLLPPRQRLPRDDKALNVLILGGSQGAKALNQLVLQMLNEYPEARQWHFWHQTGQLDFPQIQKNYQQLTVSIKVNAFIQNIVSAYEWADLVICRSGALTVAELAAAGVASILIPFPYAVDDHQWHNAKYLADAGAAIVLREKEVTANKLYELMGEFAQHRERLLDMAERARQLANTDAVNAIVTILQQQAVPKTDCAQSIDDNRG